MRKNMKEVLMVFTDHNASPVVAKITSVGRKKVQTAFKAACKKAVENGFCGMNYEVPAEYLEEEGLTLEILPHHEMQMDHIESSKIPVRICRCNECSSYDDGVCLYYGGTTDGLQDSSCCTRLHGCGYNLCFDGEEVISSAFETKLDARETAEYILHSDIPSLQPLRTELINFLEDAGMDPRKPLPENSEDGEWYLEDRMW